MTTAIIRLFDPQAFDGSQAIHAGHAQVHQYHLRLQFSTQAYGLGPIGCLADQFKTVLRLKDEPQSLADDQVVVGHQDADRIHSLAGSSNGNPITICVPFPGSLCISKDATRQADAFAHSQQTVMARLDRFRIETHAIITDLDLQLFFQHLSTAG